jgi:RNA polymerase sigma-B factor
MDAVSDERASLIGAYLPLADHLSRRFGRAQESADDLRQVAALALVRAVDRRDPARSATLPAYIVRCVEGELRRHLRDGSIVRVPRAADRASASAATARAPLALEERDLPVDPHDEPGAVLDRVLVAGAARHLTPREREVVLGHYFLDRTQAEIGADLGISQAHVSRILATALGKMRRDVETNAPLCLRTRRATLGTSVHSRDTRPGDA